MRVIGQIRPVVAWDFAHRPHTFRRIGIQRGHVNLGPGFIHDDQILGGQLLGLLLPGCAGRFILFAGSQRLFFRVQPNAMRARLMLAVLTAMP